MELLDVFPLLIPVLPRDCFLYPVFQGFSHVVTKGPWPHFMHTAVLCSADIVSHHKHILLAQIYIWVMPHSNCYTAVHFHLFPLHFNTHVPSDKFICTHASVLLCYIIIRRKCRMTSQLLFLLSKSAQEEHSFSSQKRLPFVERALDRSASWNAVPRIWLEELKMCIPILTVLTTQAM